MGKIKSQAKEDAAVNAVIAEAFGAFEAKRVFDAEQFHTILDQHGFGLIDNRLWEFLEDLPVGLDDLIEDDEEEDE